MNPMNLMTRLRGGLTGPNPPAPAPTPEPTGLPCYCPDCGSGNATEATERDRRSTRLTCPDCGLNQKTEILR